MDEINVQCLPYMPLQIERLRRSKAWLRCKRKPEIAFYMINLWMRSWHELPAGSIEDDDDVLADAAMCSPEAWAELKHEILSGWERRDGRVWHATVIELAAEAATKLRGNKKRTELARIAAEERRKASVTDPVTDTVTESVTDSVTGHEGKGREGKRREKKKEEDVTADAVPAPFEFEGETIKLTPKDFDKWLKAFPSLSLMSELYALDEWAGHQKASGKNWFNAVSGALAKKQREFNERVGMAKVGRENSASPKRKEGRI